MSAIRPSGHKSQWTEGQMGTRQTTDWGMTMLTDDDRLRKIEESIDRRSIGFATQRDLRDLIADLRASRVRVGELEAQVETAERQRDELAIALDEIDHLTYGWTFARVGSVIDKIRIRARAELAALGWSADRLAALDTPPAKEA